MSKTPSFRSANVRRPPPLPRIGVLVETSTLWGRNVCSGIQKYVDHHAPWLVFIEPLGMEQRIMIPKGWRGNGVITRIAHPALARQLKALRIPVINVSAITVPDAPFPRVITDLTAAARLAADYFLERGFRSFAYFSLLGLHYVKTHQEAFAERLKKAGCAYAVYPVRPTHGAEPDWNLDLSRLGHWLRSLPKPVAVLCWNATCSREVLFACQLEGLLVPEEVAILCGSDDDVLCEKALTPISGIQIAAEQIGYRAAGLLDRLLKRESLGNETVLIPPLGLTTRRSTDTLAISDVPLVKALHFIKDHATDPIRVADISAHSGLSRRALERKFESVLGRSPASEIRRRRIEHARTLLLTTDMTATEIAEAAGLGTPQYLSFFFKKIYGITPLKYRRNVRAR